MSGARRIGSLAAALLGMGSAACAGAMGGVGSPAPAASRVDTFRVAMPQLGGRERTVRVYTPPGYARSRDRYPVLYMQDGQNLFSPGLYGDWRMDEALDSLVAAGRMRGLIVVGIDSGERRWDEYGPWSNPRMMEWVDGSWSRPAEGGQGAEYVAFLAETLKPEIDRRYRTRPEREWTAIGGASMGGLISIYAGLTRPDVFSRVLAMSTAAWFAEGGGDFLSRNRMVDFIRERGVPRGVRFYLDVGSNERSRDRDPDVRDAEGRPLTYPRAYLRGSWAVHHALSEAGRLVEEEDLRHVVGVEAVHNEAAWGERFPSAILWLFHD